MSGYSPEIERAGITWGQLKKCRDDDYVCTMVSAFMLVQVLDNLYGVRLTLLHGYLSVTFACMRGVVESLRLMDLLRHSPVIAHPWLDGVKISDLKQPKGFKPATPVKEVMKLFDARSTGGSHAAFLARPLSALAEPEASKLLGDKRCGIEVESALQEINKTSADFLFYLLSSFPQVTGQEGFSEPKLGQVLEELDDRFGIRLDGYAGQVHEARRIII